MEFTELIAWFEQAPADPERLRALASSLGLELTRRRGDHLGAAMAALGAAMRAPDVARARVADTASTGFRAGYLAAIEDLLRAFQAELGEEESERELVHYARAEPYRGVLLAMGTGAATSTEIAAAMGKHKSSASRALAALREAGLVASYSAPDGNERLRPHALTLRGQRVLTELRRQAEPGQRRGLAAGSSDKVAASKKAPAKSPRPPVRLRAR